MKVVFLDIDGVLDIFEPTEQFQKLLEPALLRLKRMIAETEAKIVVISNWRYGHERYTHRIKSENEYLKERRNWEQLVRTFREYDLAIYDVSPWEDGLKTRSEEITCYLNSRSDITSFVILDDCYSDRYESSDELKSRLVFVDANKALQDRDVELALRILAEERPADEQELAMKSVVKSKYRKEQLRCEK